MTVEKNNGIHSKERLQYTESKSVADRYAEFHNLDFSKCDSNVVEDVNKRGKVRILEE